MYLNIGNNKNIRIKNIFGIFDADATTVSPVTRQYLAAAERRGAVGSAGEEIPKSFVVYRDRHGMCVCFSQFSAASLQKRIDEAEGEQVRTAQ